MQYKKIGPLGPVSNIIMGATTITDDTDQIPITSWTNKPIAANELHGYWPRFQRLHADIEPLLKYFVHNVSGLTTWDSAAGSELWDGFCAYDGEHVANGQIKLTCNSIIKTVPAAGSGGSADLLKFPLIYNSEFFWDRPRSDFPVTDITFCNRYYADTAALMNAFNSRGSDDTMFAGCPLTETWYLGDKHLMGPKPRSFVRPDTNANDFKEMAQIYQPDGCPIHRHGRTIEWRGWSFHLDQDNVYGMVVSNVKFGGERILYEMHPTDFGVYYTGPGANHNTHFSDGAMKQGSTMETLVEGIDCPAGSMYFDSNVNNAGAWGLYNDAGSTSNALCAFERPNGAPIFRHSKQPSAYAQYKGLPQTDLVVRSIMRVGNYDYIVDYVFSLDGKIEASKSASGYSVAEYGRCSEHNGQFGSCFADEMFGNLHMHTAGFKVDLDIGNGYATDQLRKTIYHQNQPYTATGLTPAPTVNSHTTVPIWADRTIVGAEDSWVKMNDHTRYTVVSSTLTNSYGSKRGYTLNAHPGALMMSDADPRYKYFDYSQKNIGVSKRKNAEPINTCLTQQTGSGYDCRTATKHVVDGEDISSGEDLVMWVGLNHIHDPISEDVPMPRVFGSGFTLTPTDFFDNGGYADLPNLYGATKQCVM